MRNETHKIYQLCLILLNVMHLEKDTTMSLKHVK